jgi:chemotaxis methyl-accepting protein methylase
VRSAAAASASGRALGSFAPAPSVDTDALRAVLDVLRERDALDLSGYRAATLARRVQNRLIAAGDASVAEYLERLRADPGETARLLDRLTIKVSRFHRNREAVEAVSDALAAELVRAARRLRIWSAGCGRGEEPYTLAIVLAELGQPGDGPPAIVATDVDRGALAVARAGAYGENALEEVPPAIRRRWFAVEGPAHSPRWRVAEELRRRVGFEPHDLAGVARQPSGGPFDLVVCRNTLIYFEPPLQRRALALLCSSLAPGGLLWLGEAEWPPEPLAGRLHALDRRARLFRLLPEESRDDA